MTLFCRLKGCVGHSESLMHVQVAQIVSYQGFEGNTENLEQDESFTKFEILFYQYKIQISLYANLTLSTWISQSTIS